MRDYDASMNANVLRAIATAVVAVGTATLPATTYAQETASPVSAPPPVTATIAATPKNYVPPPRPTHPELLPPLSADGHVKLDLVLLDRDVRISPDKRYHAWTFNGTVPGPVIHARVGDTIDVTLTNKGTIGHSIDFHAALAPPNVAYQTIQPGQTLHFSWVAKYPGAFLYHCGTMPVLAHISYGMYGAIIVEPAEGLPQAQTFVLVQSEFYTRPVPGTNDLYEGDFTKMQTARADVVAFNGLGKQYVQNPLTIDVGKPVRVWVVDAGPSHISAFHVVGTLFSRVLLDGNPQNALYGIQTANIPPGGGAVAEFTVFQPGRYAFVTHAFGDADLGAMGIFLAK
jgi:nitrite reductase (NO-forming)